MPINKQDVSDGARKAYAAQRKENLKLWLGGICFVLGMGVIFLTAFAHMIVVVVGGPVAVILLAAGYFAYRATVTFEIAKKGPRIPRRIRLPFDSVVEIGVTVNQVQGRADIVVGDRLPPEPKKETETSE